MDACVVLDRTLPLSPLVRFALANFFNVGHLAVSSLDQAVEQYRSNPDAYDAVFRDRLPAGFRAAARAVRD